ncbi:MAG: DsrE family protein [Sulfuricellaceae bacterium]|nr:DsrE family protein [Sulfuricellaceae bacterium]
MIRNKVLSVLVRGIIITGLCWSAQTLAADASPASADHAITIDIPVALKEVKVVFNMDHVALAGDLPVGMKYMDLLSKKIKMDKASGKIIGVFHGAAAYMTLNDQAYNANRHVTTGNPYKHLIAGLQAEGVQIEECAVSMKGSGWGNKDLLPGVKVNTGAVGRLIQLTQEGYVQIQP